MKPLIAMLCLAACGSSQPSKPGPTPVPGAVVEGRVKAPDGVELVYDVRGQGDTTLVFVHCWTCDRTFWKDQLDVFAKEYRVISLDLGGHGKSGDNRAAWTIASLGGDVQAVVEKLDAKNVILVGHSMGGPVALDAARRMPGRVKGIACVDTLHDAEVKMPPEMRDQIVKGFETNWEPTMKQGMKLMFRAETDPAVVEYVQSRTLAANQKVAVPLMRELFQLELGPMLAAAKVPIRCVNVAPYWQLAAKTNVETNRKYADFDAVIMDNVGHFVQLEKPAELNEKLRAIIRSIK
jgi:pimeloyl-ACP methyl ester carboxylesterase